MSGMPSWISGSGWEALSDDREWLGGPPGCSGVVGRPSPMSRSGQESLQEVREALRMSGSCRETFLIVQEWWESLLDVRELSGSPTGSLGVSPGCSGVVGRP